MQGEAKGCIGCADAELQVQLGSCRAICRVKSAGSHLSCTKVTTLSLQVADFFFSSDYRWDLQGGNIHAGFGQKIYSTSSITHTRLVSALASRRRVAIRPVQRSPQLWGLRPPATFPGAHVQVSARWNLRTSHVESLRPSPLPTLVNRCRPCDSRECRTRKCKRPA